MAQDKKLTEKKLSALWKDKSIPEVETKNKKIVLLSDVHLGDGGGADDFRHNHDAMQRALNFYKNNKYVVILLGDIEELWQFDLDKIIAKYDATVYKKLRAFPQNALYRVYGNHDSDWGVPDDPTKEISGVTGVASVAIKLKDKNGTPRILLVHGNQGSLESDKHSWASKFFVRIYKTIEPVFKIDPHKSAIKSQIAKNYECILYSWAKKEKVILICGHSHRAIFASESYLDKLYIKMNQLDKELIKCQGDKKRTNAIVKEQKKIRKEIVDEELKNRKIDSLESKGELKPCYFNTGCALYTSGITAIEIEKEEIRLVQWNRKVKKGVEKVCFEKGSLTEYINRTIA